MKTVAYPHPVAPGQAGTRNPGTQNKYILASEFKDVYDQARRIPRGGAAVRGFINYSFDLEALDRLKKYQERKVTNSEPLAQT